MTDKWYLNGDYLLGLMVVCVHIPLGMLKKIDFLGFTSFIGMACMSTFVFMVIKKVFFNSNIIHVSKRYKIANGAQFGVSAILYLFEAHSTLIQLKSARFFSLI